MLPFTGTVTTTSTTRRNELSGEFGWDCGLGIFYYGSEGERRKLRERVESKGDVRAKRERRELNER